MHISAILLLAPLAIEAAAIPYLAQRDSSTPPTPPGNTTAHVPSGSQSESTANNLKLIHQLERAPTAVERQALLSEPSDHVFDFNKAVLNSNTTGAGGHTVKADRLGFPALIGTGVSMTVGFLGPCGFNTPHTHPRSAEMNFIAQGRLIAEHVAENGVSVVRNEIKQHQMTVFPQGALHTEFNPDCTDAIFVAGFASEDPGVQQAAQSLFELDDDLIEAAFISDFTFEGAQIDQLRSVIPKNVALGVESCLKKCKMAKK